MAPSGHGAGSKTVTVNCYIVNMLLPLICITIQAALSLRSDFLPLIQTLSHYRSAESGTALLLSVLVDTEEMPSVREKIKCGQGSCPLSRAPGFCILAHPHSQSSEHYEKLCARDNPKYENLMLEQDVLTVNRGYPLNLARITQEGSNSC